MNPNPQEALRYYREALEMAAKLNMDPLSAEVTGIRIELAGFLEAIKQYKTAIKVLEHLRKDGLEWLETKGDQPGNETKRTALLVKMIGVAMKLAELYEEQKQGQDLENARSSDNVSIEHVNWAVETFLKERQRREKDETKRDHEDGWMTPEQGMALLESTWWSSVRCFLALIMSRRTSTSHLQRDSAVWFRLALAPPVSCLEMGPLSDVGTADAGSAFHRRSEWHLAIPLYQTALQMQTAPDCHSVTLCTLKCASSCR